MYVHDKTSHIHALTAFRCRFRGKNRGSRGGKEQCPNLVPNIQVALSYAAVQTATLQNPVQRENAKPVQRLADRSPAYQKLKDTDPVDQRLGLGTSINKGEKII